MEPYTAMYTAAVLLGIGAVGGVVMALIRFSGAPRPPWRWRCSTACWEPPD